MEHDLYVDYCGVCSPTENWHLSQDIEIQRLYYILGGTGGYCDDMCQKHYFHQGHLYLFPYNLRHRFFTDKTDPVRHLFFDFLSSPPIIAAEPLCICVDTDSQLSEALVLANRILRTHSKSTLAETRLSKHLLQLLLDLAHERTPLPFYTDPVICDSIKTIQSDYSKPITVRELASQAGFEENHFIRRFRNVMKQTPYAYLKNYRLIQARNLLAAGISVEDAAHKVGYESPSSLTRALRRSAPSKNT